MNVGESLKVQQFLTRSQPILYSRLCYLLHDLIPLVSEQVHKQHCYSDLQSDQHLSKCINLIFTIIFQLFQPKNQYSYHLMSNKQLQIPSNYSSDYNTLKCKYNSLRVQLAEAQQKINQLIKPKVQKRSYSTQTQIKKLYISDKEICYQLNYCLSPYEQSQSKNRQQNCLVQNDSHIKFDCSFQTQTDQIQQYSENLTKISQYQSFKLCRNTLQNKQKTSSQQQLTAINIQRESIQIIQAVLRTTEKAYWNKVQSLNDLQERHSILLKAFTNLNKGQSSSWIADQTSTRQYQIQHQSSILSQSGIHSQSGLQFESGVDLLENSVEMEQIIKACQPQTNLISQQSKY